VSHVVLDRDSELLVVPQHRGRGSSIHWFRTYPHYQKEAVVEWLPTKTERYPKMRKHFLVDWAFASQGSVEKVVQTNFAHEAHRWPLLRSFDSEGYIWNSTHLIVILRDKLSGIPAVGSRKTLEDPNAPTEAPTLANLGVWQSYMRSKFAVKAQDMVIIIPIVDKGPNVENDWAEWAESDKQLWHRQIEFNITQHFYHLKGFDIVGEFFIPPGYLFLADECERFFKDHQRYDRNILIMTRFVTGNRLLEELDRELRSVLREYNLNPVRADDKMYLRDRNLWNNVCVYMICCKFGIAILEDRVADEFNPNVALEYGFMRALSKPVLLLADVGFRNLRADIIGTLREQFDITDIKGTIKLPLERWLKEVGLIGGS